MLLETGTREALGHGPNRSRGSGYRQRVGSCTRSTAIQKTLRSIYYEHSWPIGERT
jgi:hypothetical protein